MCPPNPVTICFCFLISTTFLCEFECSTVENVGLFAGRYSGRRRPDLYRTPQALQSVLGPIGPARHCGVLSAWQCKHLLPMLEPLLPIMGSCCCCRGNDNDSGLYLTLTWFDHNICWLNMSPKATILLRRLLLVRGRTGMFVGTLKLSQQLATVVALPLLFVLLLLLLVLFSSTEIGLWCFIISSGLSDKMPKHVSTPGNASLFDSHSKSSSSSINTSGNEPARA